MCMTVLELKARVTLYFLKANSRDYNRVGFVEAEKSSMHPIYTD